MNPANVRVAFRQLLERERVHGDCVRLHVLQGIVAGGPQRQVRHVHRRFAPSSENADHASPPGFLKQRGEVHGEAESAVV